MLNKIGKIRKMADWYPAGTVSDQAKDHSGPAAHAGRIIKNQQFLSNNVTFPVNSALVAFFISGGIILLFNISRYLDYLILATAVIVIYSLFYLLVFKAYRSGILIDEKGVHLRSFTFRDITLGWTQIRSARSFSWKTKKHTAIVIWSILLISFILIISWGITEGNWKLVVTTVPVLPVAFLLHLREKASGYHDLNTQVYIESRTKRWYDLSPYYSVITDDVTAKKICSSIKYYTGAK